MRQTVESIREYGVLVPAIARPLENGTYELISGHRRKHACELAGLETMPVIVRNIDRNTATIIMVDSILQRENILPSERAKAYKIKIEAIVYLSYAQDGSVFLYYLKFKKSPTLTAKAVKIGDYMKIKYPCFTICGLRLCFYF